MRRSSSGKLLMRLWYRRICCHPVAAKLSQNNRTTEVLLLLHGSKITPLCHVCQTIQLCVVDARGAAIAKNCFSSRNGAAQHVSCYRCLQFGWVLELKLMYTSVPAPRAWYNRSVPLDTPFDCFRRYCIWFRASVYCTSNMQGKPVHMQPT